MGKKDKKSKKNKPNEIDWSLYPEGTTEIPNPNFYFGSDAFKLQNGDVYVGDFCAHRIGLTWREGNGIYMTKDDHTYEGVWENDQLLESEETIVRFPDNVEYRGPIKRNQYSGLGKYTLPNKLPIICNFEGNTPFGEAILTDPQNHLWRGNVGEEYVILLPENHFYINLPYERGKGKKVSINRSAQEIRSAESVKSSTSCMRVLKTAIFKHSHKIVPSLKLFTEETSKKKITDEETTVSENLEPPTCDKIVKPKSSLLKAKSASNVSLLKTFLSKEYRNSFHPVPTFRPTVDTEKEEQQS